MKTQPDIYSTDGRVVKNQNGDCMGIFSTVSLLNDKEAQNFQMITFLKELANEDFRGNRGSASVNAFKLLEKLEIK